MTEKKRLLFSFVILAVGFILYYLMVKIANGHTDVLQPAYGFLMVIGVGGGWLAMLALRTKNRATQAIATLFMLVSLGFCIDALRLLALANTFQMNVR